MQRKRELLKRWLLAAQLLVSTGGGAKAAVKTDVPEAARQAYEKSDYSKAVQELLSAAAKEPQNGEIQLLLTKAYIELQEYDAAISSAEKAIAINPKSSVYHEWLGKACGEKASHASMFSAMGLAKRTHREFETAVELDERNFAAEQALIEFECSAPGVVGGGEDKAKPQIEKLRAMDQAEWHYAAGNCRRQKKDFTTADTEFRLALESHPKSADLVYDIGDYALRRGQAERLLETADVGEQLAPTDPRGKFYRATAFVLKNEKPEEAERLLREYLRTAPRRTAYPRYAIAHEWLGRLYENRGDKEAATREYQAAVQLDPKDKNARDGLRRVGKS